jgi:hypothetical protein
MEDAEAGVLVTEFSRIRALLAKDVPARQAAYSA